MEKTEAQQPARTGRQNEADCCKVTPGEVELEMQGYAEYLAETDRAQAASELLIELAKAMCSLYETLAARELIEPWVGQEQANTIKGLLQRLG
jgi:hypothetical protein